MLGVAEYLRSHQASWGLFLLKVLKIVLEIQYPSPFLSLYQRSENLSQAMHVPGEGGLKGHDLPSSDFNCLFRCYLSTNIFQLFYVFSQSYLVGNHDSQMQRRISSQPSQMLSVIKMR